MNALKPPVREGAVVLGYTPMDDVHAEFSDLVERAIYCADADFFARLDALVAHLEAHFGLEDQWMAETDFPPETVTATSMLPCSVRRPRSRR